MATKKNFSDFMFIGQTETDSPRKNGYNLYERERGREGGEKKMSGWSGGRGGREEGGERGKGEYACMCILGPACMVYLYTLWKYCIFS